MNKSLSKPTQELLDKLVEDYTKYAGDKKFMIEDAPGLIHNLFRGDYKFSVKQYKELFNYFMSYEKEN